MKHLLQTITGSTLIFASFLNSQLVYNAYKFDNEPAAFEARLVQMHTGIRDGQPVFFKPAKEANHKNLVRFFGMIK
jgi:tRNA(His) 5'-end guanylyltransferase